MNHFSVSLSYSPLSHKSPPRISMKLSIQAPEYTNAVLEICLTANFLTGLNRVPQR